MGKIIERIVDAQRMEDIISVFGSFDENIKRIEDEFHVSIVNRGTELKVSGDEEAADRAVRTLEGLLTLSSKGEQIDEQRVRYLMNLVREGNDAQVAKMTKGVICITAKGKPMWRPSRRTPLPSAWGLRVPARPIWRWLPPWRPSGSGP